MPNFRSLNTFTSMLSPSFSFNAATTSAGSRMAKLLPHFETCMIESMACVDPPTVVRRGDLILVSCAVEVHQVSGAGAGYWHETETLVEACG
jgi:hypothetical protein